MTTQERKREREAYVELSLGIRPNLEMTLSEGFDHPTRVIHRKMTKFFNIISRQSLGVRWNWKDPKERPYAIGFLEHADSNRHWHLMVSAQGLVRAHLLDGGELTWRELAPKSHYHCKELQRPEKFAWYATKEGWRDGRLEDAFIYVPTRVDPAVRRILARY